MSLLLPIVSQAARARKKKEDNETVSLCCSVIFMFANYSQLPRVTFCNERNSIKEIATGMYTCNYKNASG